MFQNNSPNSHGIFSKRPFHLHDCVLVARLHQAAGLHLICSLDIMVEISFVDAIVWFISIDFLELDLLGIDLLELLS
jgi:hypothetical protein